MSADTKSIIIWYQISVAVRNFKIIFLVKESKRNENNFESKSRVENAAICSWQNIINMRKHIKNFIILVVRSFTA